MYLLLGTVVLLPFDFIPQGYQACRGQLMGIAENPALFSLLGNRFGGDGRITFALPELSAAAPKGLQYCMVVDGRFPDRVG